jgi:hypothetical protein
MLARLTAKGQFFEFDVGDWLVLLGGLVLAGSLVLLV